MKTGEKELLRRALHWTEKAMEQAAHLKPGAEADLEKSMGAVVELSSALKWFMETVRDFPPALWKKHPDLPKKRMLALGHEALEPCGEERVFCDYERLLATARDDFPAVRKELKNALKAPASRKPASRTKKRRKS